MRAEGTSGGELVKVTLNGAKELLAISIAIAVVVNNKGEGATWAAPIFRRVMEIYFFGHPQTVYPWESGFGVVNPDYGLPVTPTPEP